MTVPGAGPASIDALPPLLRSPRLLLVSLARADPGAPRPERSHPPCNRSHPGAQTALTKARTHTGGVGRRSNDSRASAASGGRWYAELSADLASEGVVDLAVARDYGARSFRACPAGVACAFVDRCASVSAEMALEVTAFHAAIVRCSRSRSRWSSALAGSGESISRSASMTLERASSRVRPWLKTPATCGIEAMSQPFSPGS